MARRLRPVELDFVESAPLRLVFAAEVSASPRRCTGARRGCRGLDLAGSPRSPRPRPPAGARAARSRLKGGVLFAETILATDPGERYAYRVDETNAPGLRALLEEWRLTPTATGTRVQWTFAADAPAPMRCRR